MDYKTEITDRIVLVLNIIFNGNKSEFARKLCVDESRIRSYVRETDKRAMPSSEFISKLITALDINHEWILFGHGEMKRKMYENSSVIYESGVDVLEEEEKEYRKRTITVSLEEYNRMKHHIDDLIITNKNLSELLKKKNPDKV